MKDRDTKISALKNYFADRPDVIMAFVFGSQAKGFGRAVSDWDIAVYFMPASGMTDHELETYHTYTGEQNIWGDLERILQVSVDMVVLNRSRPPLVFSILNTGVPLTVKNRSLYVSLLIKTHYEAVDFWGFVEDFWRIRQRSCSLSPEDRGTLIKQLVFLENEFSDLPQFKSIDEQTYLRDRNIKRNIERWVENLVMASLDIAKIVLAAEKKNVPQTYKETLKTLGLLLFDEPFAEKLAASAAMRNLVAHEYLDLRWKRISTFLREAEGLYPPFTARLKRYLEENTLQQ